MVNHQNERIFHFQNLNKHETREPIFSRMQEK